MCCLGEERGVQARLLWWVWGVQGVLTCCFPHREEFMIPLIPLGLKETKDVDFSVVLKVGPPTAGPGNWQKLGTM